MNTYICKIQLFRTLMLLSALTFPLFVFADNGQECTKSNHRDSLCTIQFQINTSNFDLNYKLNRSALSAMRAYLDTVNFAKIDSVIIVGSTSPEGNKNYNTSLALKRAQSLKDILVADGKIPEDMLKTTVSKDPWSEIFDIIKDDPNFPNKDKTLAVLKKTPISGRMWMLKKLNYNKEYHYLVHVSFSRLRNATTIIIYKKNDNSGQTEVLSKSPVEAIRDSNQTSIEKSDSSTVTEPVNQSSVFVVTETLPVSLEEPQKPLFALKTNLLYDAATIINLSLEVPIGKQWSIAGEFIFPWWLDKKNQNCLQVFNANLEVKYWFNPHNNQKKGKFSTMTGWFAGVYGGGAVYDVEYHSKGYQGESLFSTGFMGGYAHSIGKCLRLEYSLGIGYMQTHYRQYESRFSTLHNQWELYRQDSGKAKWIGPTHAKISLVWMLSRNVKKGGTK